MKALPAAVGILLDGLLMLLCMMFAVVLVGILVVEASVRGWRNTARWIKVCTLCAVGALLMLMVVSSNGAMARDDGRYAASPHKKWFDGLKNKKSYPCCSDADGFAVSDPDWETKDGKYRVRIDGKWVDVPDEAIIEEPNRVGRTMVWPMPGVDGPTIRCFIPGALT